MESTKQPYIVWERKDGWMCVTTGKKPDYVDAVTGKEVAFQVTARFHSKKKALEFARVM